MQKKPKRALCAYNLFFKHERQRILGSRQSHPFVKTYRSHGKIGFTELARSVAKKWKALDKAGKAPFEAIAAVESARYEEEYYEWKTRKGQSYYVDDEDPRYFASLPTMTEVTTAHENSEVFDSTSSALHCMGYTCYYGSNVVSPHLVVNPCDGFKNATTRAPPIKTSSLHMLKYATPRLLSTPCLFTSTANSVSKNSTLTVDFLACTSEKELLWQDFLDEATCTRIDNNKHLSTDVLFYNGLNRSLAKLASDLDDECIEILSIFKKGGKRFKLEPSNTF